MIIFIETWKNNTIIKVKIEAWRKTEMDEKRFAIKETVSVEEVKNYRTYIKNQSKEKSGYKIKELSNHFLSIIINLKELFKT